MTSSDSKIEKIQTHFKALSSVAPTLNAASDELTKAVAVLDENLKKLNVGLTAWVTFRSRAVYSPSLSDEEYDTDQIGYGKVDGKWGIALRHVWGNYALEEFGSEGPWLFNDAPRELRLASVDKLPEMIEALSNEASETTKKVRETTRQVHDLAAAVAEVANQPRAALPKKVFSVSNSEISAQQRESILLKVRNQQKFLGEIVQQASRWEHSDNELRIYFPASKHGFAEMLQGRDSLARVAVIAKEVFGDSTQVVVKVEPPVVIGSTAGKDKGGK